MPERKVLYQFCARGHDLAQILLGLHLTDPHDGASVYYRSRPLMLALGADLEELAAGPLAREGSCTGGRDIGVVFNRPGRGGRQRAAGRAAASARSTPRRPAGRRRSATATRCSRMPPTRAASRWCSAGTPRSPPTASGRRSPSPPP